MKPSLPHEVERMGPALRAEVERQLFTDLEHYGLSSEELTIDWSDCCQEGHVTEVLGGTLEEMSGVAAVDLSGSIVADGWVDFIHGGGDHPLFVFWLFLTLNRHAQEEAVKREPTIPEHVWSRLPESSKALCAKSAQYDARWASDPLVKMWTQAKDQPASTLSRRRGRRG